ncbi:MAG: hypothetical protein KJ574_01785 [Nanoarchaeota archaeon]|nr:hypothetical protein [Nanoarchaeota archaeon]
MKKQTKKRAMNKRNNKRTPKKRGATIKKLEREVEQEIREEIKKDIRKEIKQEKKDAKRYLGIWAIYDKIKSEPKPFCASLLFDLIFVLVVLLLSGVLSSLIIQPSEAGFTQFVQQYSAYILIGIVLYYFIFILAYSFFKFIILSYVRKYFEDKASKEKFSFKRFGSFYAMNLLTALLFFLVFAIVVILLGLAVRKDYLIWFRDIFVFIVLLIAYSLINSMHSYFAQGERATASVRKAFRLLSHPRPLMGVLASAIAMGVVAYGVAFMLDFLLRYVYLRLIGLPYYYYYWTVAGVTFILTFLVIAFHRVFFYARTSEVKS